MFYSLRVIRKTDMQMMGFLIEHSASVNCEHKKSNTPPVYECFFSNSVEIYTILNNTGVYVNQQKHEEYTSLMLLASENALNIIKPMQIRR